MVFSRRLLTPALIAMCAAATLLSACIDDSPGPATAVSLQPTVVRPPLATTPPAPPTPAAPSPSPSPAAASRTFVVREGDSLSTIAALVYGDASEWRPIFEANRDQLPSQSQLQIGQTLRIPPLPPTPTPAPTLVSPPTSTRSAA